MSSLQQRDMLYLGSEIRRLLVSQSGKSIITGVTCGLEHPTSPPASPTAPPPTFPTAEVNRGEVQQSSLTTTKNCLSGMAMIRVIKQRLSPRVTGTGLTTVKSALKNALVRFQPENGHRTAQYPSEVPHRTGNSRSKCLMETEIPFQIAR